MKRYFTKIDENSDHNQWKLDKDANDALVDLNYIQHYSPLCINIYGNLFAVVEQTEQDKLFKVLFLSESPEGMLHYFDINEFTSADAYYWASEIGNQDVMIDRITSPEYALLWGMTIGDRDIMIDKITKSDFAYYWAFYIGNQDVMIDRITESNYAYHWAKDIGNKEIMRKRITDEYWMKRFEQIP